MNGLFGRGGIGIGLAAGLAALLAGCTVSGRSVVAEVDGGEWSAPVELLLPNSDTLGRYDWQLFLRCAERLPADSFTLRITVLTPDSLRFEELLPVRLSAQPAPAPVMPPIEIDYRREVQLARTGLYRLRIGPLQPLRGIEAVGIQTLKCD